MAQRTIAVIGSLNIDFVTRTPRVPEGGETLTANSFDTGFGGKGANQCVACARLAPDDVKVRMVGQVGEDSFGRDYVTGLKKEGIDTSGVREVKGEKTGIANIIVVEKTGENRILLAANANHAYSDTQDNGWELVPEDADMVVLQLEIPLQVVLHNMHTARESGKHVVFNPAPAVLLPDFAYQDIDTLILNETESEILAGPRDLTPSHQKLTPEQLAPLFLEWGVKEAVIITLGTEGLVYATKSGASGRVPAQKVKAVDTTAAGDTFVGAYAVQRVKHVGAEFDFEGALGFATAASARTVQRRGAMDSIPFLRDVE